MNTSLNRLMVAVGALGAATGAVAVEYGVVVSSTPIVSGVPVRKQECVDQPVVYQQPNTGAGSVIGGIAGAAIGNNLGSGGGRAAATAIGLIAGSIIGDRVEADSAPTVTSTARQCRTVTRYENRTVGYDVVYDFQGVRRRTQLAQDPGERIALNINVAPVNAAPAAQPMAEAEPIRTPYPQAAAPIYYPAPSPSPYYAAPYYAAPYYAYPWPLISIGLGYSFGWGGGHRHGHGGHGR